MKCPVCGAIYRPGIGNSLTCRRCKADLSDLIRLYDQAIWYHRQALYFLQLGSYSEAKANNNQALALYNGNAEFHTLAGKLSALEGNFPDAITCWQRTLQVDPQNAIASTCLEMISVIRNSV